LEVEVTFEELYPHYTTDDDLPQSYCQTLETYARLYVATQSRQFWGGNFFKPVKCHTVSLYEYTDFYKPLYKDGKPNVIKVEVPILKEPGLNAPRPISVTVGARMWDHDDSSGDDLVASFQETFWFPDYESIPGPEYYGMGKVMHLYTGSQTTTEAEDSHWRYTIWFRKVD
jgi:hypothetical protein